MYLLFKEHVLFFLTLSRYYEIIQIIQIFYHFLLRLVNGEIEAKEEKEN